MTFPILASWLVRLVVLLPFQLLRLSLATPSRWTPLALSVFLHCVVALLLTLFFQAEDGIRLRNVTGVQTCALPISVVPLLFKCRSQRELLLNRQCGAGIDAQDLDVTRDCLRLPLGTQQKLDSGPEVSYGLVPVRSEERRVVKDSFSRSERSQ